MIAAVMQPQQAVSKDAAAARKRRRRAPAGGATDDCFTCAKKNVKCDRRRPYCSQCLEVGNECSGYKTQLTWGVGVASRGKLRGLSLPIAKAPPVAGVTKKTSTSRPRTNSTATTAAWSDTDEIPRRTSRDELDMSSEHAGPTSPFPHSYDMLSMSHPDHAPSLHAGSWAHMTTSVAPYSSSVPTEGPSYRRLGAHLGPLAIPEGLSTAGSEADYLSPLSHSYPREDIPYLHSPNVMYDPFGGHGSPVPHSPAAGILLEPRAPTSCPSLVYASSDQGSSLTSHMDNYEAQLSQKLMRDCDNISVAEMEPYGTSCNSTGAVWTASSPEEMSPSHADPTPAQWPTVYEPQPVHINAELISKMPFFMDYYKNTMCQSMVFIDGPHNPYRDHILHLAQNSQSLQHAICALSACNLRMKRRLSLGQDTRELSEKLLAEKSAAEGAIDAQPEDQSLSEEYQHRNLAVHLLNQQLNDPNKSSHDSVLATILLLCHYRMVESGIAKFHTQFAGVKKILALRRKSQQYNAPRDAAWMEAIFTYFDSISASINDREAQLNTTFYGIMSDSSLLPTGAENLVGCDRELFKTISKLGRLNMLSQHRPVSNIVNSSLPRNVPSRSQSPLASPLGHAYKSSISSLHQQQLSETYNVPQHRFDGNGFGSTLNDDEALSSAIGSSAFYEDQRNNFWREWKEARQALQSWEFDAARINASLPGVATPSQVRDLGSLSEAFRYAALLYTERLASPNVPCNHSNFQNLVSQVVYYATSLEAGSSAEKFLLWPLFVAGSECVNELQQNIVRSKCRDIMARSGYMNNLSALEVLERLWAGERNEYEARSPGGLKLDVIRRGPFNWTKCIGGPGVEVEWIMF